MSDLLCLAYLTPSCHPGILNTHFKVFVVDPEVWSALFKKLLVWHIVLMALSLALTATPEGLRVRQHPPSLSVMRGETATLSCHFKVESLKYGVQWFKSEQQLISNSSRQIVVAKNQTSSLVITNTTIQDSGWYYCEVNVLKKDPEWGNGTKLVVLGKKQIAGFRNEHAHNLLGPLRPGDVAMLVIMSHSYLLYTGATTFSTRQLDTSTGKKHVSP